MCGIAVLISRNSNRERLNKILENISYRGTDNRGIEIRQYKDKFIHLGHNRLAIQDISSAGNQPMMKDDLVWIINGEIWNYKELKTKFNLKTKSNSDSEIIGSLYGKNKLGEIDGMFAFVILDKNKLIVSRDYLGIIPLYIGINDEEIYLCSELKGFVEFKPTTVKFIPPNSLIEIDLDTMKVSTKLDYYFVVSDKLLQPKSDQEVSDKTYELMDFAVKKRMIGDVPLCTFNSGGMDSSVITYLAKQYNPDLTCYTAVFKKNSGDHVHAKILADHLKLNLVEVFVNESEIEKRFIDSLKTIEYPLAVQAECGIVQSAIMEQMKKDGFKIALSGELSDETVGYPRYKMFANKPDYKQMRLDMLSKQHYGNLLRGNLIAMKYATIELRVPFEDKDYIDYVLNLPVQFIHGKGNQMKKHLANAFRGKLPDSIIDRKKDGFQTGTGIKDHIDKIVLNSGLNKNKKTSALSLVGDLSKQYYPEINFRNTTKWDLTTLNTKIKSLF